MFGIPEKTNLQHGTKGPDVGDCVIWGGIHHKTSMEPGNIHGYPDIGYLKRVTTDLSNLGVNI